MRWVVAILCLALTGLPRPALSHPHIFVDTGVEFLFDADGKVGAIRVIWVYDELYSLLVAEEMGLDDDYDGVLTAEEEARLSGFDMNWVEGFEGDTRALVGGRPAALTGPLDWGARMVEGKIITTHVRAFEERVDPADALVLRLYDPTFYTAYSASLAPRVTGAEGCAAEVVPFDEDNAYEVLDAALAEAEAAGANVEMDFPAVGAVFADEVHLTCAR